MPNMSFPNMQIKFKTNVRAWKNKHCVLLMMWFNKQFEFNKFIFNESARENDR